MPDRPSLMLDSMMLVVDEGHSYDGVVSIPETGLEDVRYTSGLAGLLGDGMELLRTAVAAIPRMLAKFLPILKATPPSHHESTLLFTVHISHTTLDIRASVADSPDSEKKSPSTFPKSLVMPGLPLLQDPDITDSEGSSQRERNDTSTGELDSPGLPRRREDEGVRSVIPERGGERDEREVPSQQPRLQRKGSSAGGRSVSHGSHQDLGTGAGQSTGQPRKRNAGDRDEDEKGQPRRRM